MPNRIVREGILTSDRVDKLSPEAEVFYRRLMNKVDDFGLFDARLSILRTQLFPLRIDMISENSCARWLSDCVSAGLIVVYSHDGKPYLKMLDTKWQTRTEPKYPQPLADDFKCAQLRTLVVGVVVDVGVGVSGGQTPLLSPPSGKPKEIPGSQLAILLDAFDAWSQQSRGQTCSSGEQDKIARRVEGELEIVPLLVPVVNACKRKGKEFKSIAYALTTAINTLEETSGNNGQGKPALAPEAIYNSCRASVVFDGVTVQKSSLGFSKAGLHKDKALWVPIDRLAEVVVQ